MRMIDLVDLCCRNPVRLRQAIAFALVCQLRSANLALPTGACRTGRTKQPVNTVTGFTTHFQAGRSSRLAARLVTRRLFPLGLLGSTHFAALNGFGNLLEQQRPINPARVANYINSR